MSDQSWAATLKASGDRVTIRFSRPITTIGLSASTARDLAARLLLLAESIDEQTDVNGPELCTTGCGRTAELAGYCDACVHGGVGH